MGKWFLLQGEKVQGPFTHDEVRAEYAAGQTEENCLIWGRQHNLWQPLSTWLKTISQTEMQTTNDTVTQQLWHYAIEGESKGPMPRVELVNELKNLHHKGEILVWTKGMKAWADLFEFHDLLDEMGLNRREHPRSPINGSIVVKYDDQTIIGLLKSISPGGFGAVNLGNTLSIGQVVSVEIKSESLNSTVVVKSIVQYVSESGFYGFKFQSINMEAKAHIMEFIRRSKEPTAEAA